MASLRRVGWGLLLVACGDNAAEMTANGGDTSTGGTSSPTSTPTSGAEETTDPSGTDGTPAARPNWHEDIAPLVRTNCESCHATGGIAPFSLETYATAKNFAGLMAIDVTEGLMPPWHALETPECDPPFPYKHDARLSDADKQMIKDWADNGAPEGDPNLAAPLPEPPSLDLASPTKTAIAEGKLTIDKLGNQYDFYHCLSVDPGNTETVYLDGVQVVPGNKELVHHVLIYVDADGTSANWAGGVQQNCGGGGGVPGAQLIGAWVPGSLPMEAPDGVGTELPAGTRLVLSVHYHATGGGPAQDSGTGLTLRWSPTKPQWTSYFTLIGAPGIGKSLAGPLEIPAGEADHIEDYEYEIGSLGEALPDFVDVRVWTVLNHMHKVGVDMRVWIEDRDTGEETCLLHTPRWDFNWQRSYAFDSPVGSSVRVQSGDRVRIRCIYDNTMANPGVLELMNELGLDAPVDVSLGEGTGDEMCLAGVGVAIKGF